MKKKMVVVLAAFLLCMLSITACQNGTENQNDEGGAPVENAQAVTERFLAAVKSVDVETIQAVSETSAATEAVLASLADTNNKDLKEILYENLSYTIDSVQEEESTAVANITLRVPDYQEIAKAYSRSAAQYIIDALKNGEEISDADRNAKLQEILKGLLAENNTEQQELQVELKLVRSGKVWKVQPDETLFNGMTGQFFEAATSDEINAEIEKMAQELIDSAGQQ